MWYLDGSLIPGRRHPLTIRAEFQTINLKKGDIEVNTFSEILVNERATYLLTVTFVSKDASLSPDVPEFQVCVRWSGRKEVAVGMEIKTLDSGFVTSEGSYQPSCLLKWKKYCIFHFPFWLFGTKMNSQVNFLEMRAGIEIIGSYFTAISKYIYRPRTWQK